MNNIIFYPVGTVVTPRFTSNPHGTLGAYFKKQVYIVTAEGDMPLCRDPDSGVTLLATNRYFDLILDYE